VELSEQVLLTQSQKQNAGDQETNMLCRTYLFGIYRVRNEVGTKKLWKPFVFTAASISRIKRSQNEETRLRAEIVKKTIVVHHIFVSP